MRKPNYTTDAAAAVRLTFFADDVGLESCIECGICSFVCPSELPLLGGIRHLRTLRRV